ncbi:MAG: Ig-like domain-containing protein, partial [Gemmatimonadaceae bacterium]|nr:Ig-like domain-containing protein [Gemmatimonadaceae bacterium]
NGNAGAPSAARPFTVDRTVVATGAPDLAAASDTGSSSIDNLTRNTTPTFTGSGAEAGATVTLYDTNGTTVLGTGIADATGAWSIVSSTLSAGARTVTTRQVDLAGNASGASAGLSLTIDTAAPTFSKALAVNEGFTTLSLDGATLAGADNLTTQANLAISAATFKSAVGFVAGDLGISIANGKAAVTPIAGAINKNGSVVLTVSMQDAAGNTTTQDVTVTVNAVNDAPVGANRTITAPEDGVYTFSSGDFTFTDAADTPANALSSIVVSSLPGAGALRYDGQSVSGGQVVTAADLAAGRLTFTPVASASGTGYASFTFQVRDNGGTANGGVDLDASPNKITINVVDSNEAPVLDASKSPVISTVEYAFSGGSDAAVHAPTGANPAGVFTAGSLLTGAVVDADAGSKLGVGVTGLSATTVGATLWYSTDAGTTWDWISNTAGSKVTTGFYGANGVIGGTDNNVLLLADTARLVFDAGKSGQQAVLADALTIRAWDQTSGTNGGSLPNPTVGGDAPLSAATDTVQANFTTQAIDLTRLDATAGVRINGATAGAQFGWDVTSAGDANGDGFDDMLVSQRGTSGTGGSAFLVYGQAGTYGSVGADGTRSVGIGAVTGARFDRPGEFMTGVTNLGDFNNDGYADFMISGVRTNDIETGSAYVVFGGPTIASIGALGVPNANGNWFQIQAGGVTGIGYNNHVASWTGDVNGDGFDDLMIGAKYTPQQSTAPMGFGSGAAYVIYGHAGTKFGTGNDLNLGALRTDVTKLADDGNPAGYLFDAGTDTRGIVLGVGATSGFFFGRGVAGVGDRNGDGYADYSVSVDLGAGAVNALVMHGRLTTDPTNGGGGNVLWFAAADGYTGPDWIGHGVGATPNVGVNPYRIRVGGNNDYTGLLEEPDRIATQALGDINGDGFDDWAMTYNGIGAGKVFVIYGSTTVLDDQSSAAMASGTAGFSITGVAPGDKLGESIHGIGDVNGDGFDDLIVGAPRNESGTATDQGGAYIIYGRADGGADDINLANGVGTRGVAIRGSVTGDLAGFAVNSAGDVNGDGLDDLMIGAPQNDAGGADAGAAYLVYGSTTYGNTGASVGTTLTGTAGANSLVGTVGADTLNGGAGGADAIFGGAGNDIITVGSNGWRRVDGGAGLDTLTVGTAMTLDFTAVGTAAGQNLSGRTRGIERIDLGTGVGNASKLTIAEQDVYQLAGDFTASGGSLSGRQSNTLFVVGDASDSFTFAEGVGGATGWTVAATAVNALGDGNSYTEFTRGTASVYVASGVAVTGVTSGTAAANLITGTAANELIAGLAGADVITGGAGNDTLYGGAIGSTAATSEAGVRDIFAYSLTPNTAHGNDVIKDFQRGTDRLYLIDVADTFQGTPGGPSSSVAVTVAAPNGSTAAFAANGTTYQGFNPAAAVTATTNNDIDNNLSIRDLTQADSATQYLSFGTDGRGNVMLTLVAGTATSTIVLEGVEYEAVSTTNNGKYSSIADLMGANGETRVLYLTNDPFGAGLATLP